MIFCEKNEVEWERNSGSKVEIIVNVDEDFFWYMLIIIFFIIC